ncbi:MAG: DNA replication and repair protein RecF [Ignavibacteriales bacterium CG12_big_fil_rev_8_21_14_0_65_30_8]|nr:MAG: DNA replication and repair protein RecF [Ignavibacteriales bacterium CG12_big_fil_rev_8_21_14_0_65_30_8]
MKLLSIRLKNFRKHKETNLTFSKKLNFIVGSNGAGKTTILEGIYYLCTNRNFNTRNDSEVVFLGENNFEIEGKIKTKNENKVRVYYSLDNNKKTYLKNDKKINKTTEIIGSFPIVTLTPADLFLTKGFPGDRRKFFDSILCQASETYLKNLLDYNKTIKQRAALLFLLKNNSSNQLFNELESWNEKLIQSGIYLIKKRFGFINEFKKYVMNSYLEIMENEEKPNIVYSFLSSEEQNITNLEEKFRNQLKLKKEDELKRSVNLVGPHKDEFIFLLDNIELKKYGSQGQHKTFQIALRFAEFFYLKQLSGTTPMFLLDDVFGKLDSLRAKKISSYLRKVGQAFVTVTDLADFSFFDKQNDDKIIKVNEGVAKYA